MLPWDPTSPESWASRFGMVSVPAFRPTREANRQGRHAVVLDGESGSFFFSCGVASDLLQQVGAWSWSSNVSHAIIVDKPASIIHLIRWDNPSSVAVKPRADEVAAGEIISHIENAEPPTGRKSIELALEVFRTVRHEVAAFGGTDQDAVLAFNTLLAWSELDDRESLNLQDATRLLVESGLIAHTVSDLTPKILNFPLGELADLLTNPQSTPHGYSLDTDLLVRHASGTLFQEAHMELARVPHPTLFPKAPLEPVRATLRRRSDIHFTPPSLARVLVQEAISELDRLNPDVKSRVIRVLDPACGSGVFLVESLRETCNSDVDLTLIGVDSSEIACDLARFAVHRTILETGHGTYDIAPSNSLRDEWKQSDIILMNPPFLPWRSISPEVQHSIKDILGEAYTGQSDTVLAFVAKAVEALGPGCVLATVVPASFFVSRAGHKLREKIHSDVSLCVTLLGRFRGYGYFREASVEPGFIVVSRVHEQRQRLSTVKVLLSEAGREDKAIRGIRMLNGCASRMGDGWETSIKDNAFLNEPDWTPRPEQAEGVRHSLLNKVPFATDLFDIRLGIRPGLKDLFVIDKNTYDSLGKAEKSFFLPTADTVNNCMVELRDYIFYPYDGDGQLRLATDGDVSDAVPWFYTNRLKPNRVDLESRSSLRHRSWWELVEPRPTWMRKRKIRIVSPQFARAGMFALDLQGEFAVVQGHAWLWRGRDLLTEDCSWAYLAILNSPDFEAILDYFCRRIPGPRFEVANKYLSKVPLPDVLNIAPQLLSRLARLGRELHDTGHCSLPDLSDAVASAYALEKTVMRSAFPILADKYSEEQFQILSSQWKRETGHLSSLSHRMRHPAFRQIVSMGVIVVPWILSDLKIKPTWWFAALEEITGANPVPANEMGFLPQMTQAWLEWGREQGHEV